LDETNEDIIITNESLHYVLTIINQIESSLNRLEPMMRPRYRKMARLFLNTMYDEETMYSMINSDEYNINSSDIDKYLQIMRRKAIA